jgi:hypothetical protein
MLLLLPALVIFGFLLLGATMFVTCTLIPPLRQCALSVALWFAVWGPCTALLSLIALSGLFASSQLWKLQDVSRLEPFGWLFLGAGVLLILAVATAIASLHHALVKRLTFGLFRIYAASVSAGIGGVLGLAFGWWMLADTTMKRAGPPWVSTTVTLSAILLLVVGFGLAAYRNARILRGVPPRSFTWITLEEYGVS